MRRVSERINPFSNRPARSIRDDPWRRFLSVGAWIILSGFWIMIALHADAGSLNKYQMPPGDYTQQPAQPIPQTPRERIQEIIDGSPPNLQNIYEQFYDKIKPLSKSEKLDLIEFYSQQKLENYKAGNSNRAYYNSNLVRILELSIQDQIR